MTILRSTTFVFACVVLVLGYYSPYSPSYDSRPAFQASLPMEKRECATLVEIFFYIHKGRVSLQIRLDHDDYPPPGAWMILDVWAHTQGGFYYITIEKTTLTLITQYLVYVRILWWAVSRFIPNGLLDHLFT